MTIHHINISLWISNIETICSKECLGEKRGTEDTVQKDLPIKNSRCNCRIATKTAIRYVTKQFPKDCIEVYDQPINQSKIEDGFLLSQCVSVKPLTISESSSVKYSPEGPKAWKNDEQVRH